MRILFFAQARKASGLSATEWIVDAPQTADALWEWLLQQHPGLARLQGSTRLARNGEYLVGGELLSPEDEIALIPPVSGG